jgi:hypothetical protein
MSAAPCLASRQHFTAPPRALHPNARGPPRQPTLNPPWDVPDTPSPSRMRPHAPACAHIRPHAPARPTAVLQDPYERVNFWSHSIPGALLLLLAALAAAGAAPGGAPMAWFGVCAATTHLFSAMTHVYPDSHGLVRPEGALRSRRRRGAAPAASEARRQARAPPPPGAPSPPHRNAAAGAARRPLAPCPRARRRSLTTLASWC